jgi:[ribosomal protein S5]-alanine N-acetyltransferase
MRMPQAMRCVGDGRPITRKECEPWLQVTRANHARRGYGMFALELRVTGLLAGFAGIVHPGDPREAEVKYALHRAHWGRGVLRDNGDGSRTQCFKWIAGP